MINEDKILDTAWAYYQLHLERRLKFFSFFMTFLTVLTGGIFAILSTAHDNVFMYIWAVVISALLILCSFVFWKIDERNKIYRDNAREVLKNIESAYFPCDENNDIRIFTLEQQLRLQAENQKGFLKKQYKSTILFKMIFIAFALVGFIGIAISIFYFICYIT